MTRSIALGLSSSLAVASVTIFLAVQAGARPHFLPRIHMPKINVGKAVLATTYPVTKSMVNGGKTVLKTASKAETLGVMPSIGPSGLNNVAKRIIIQVGGH